jgi:O-antigen/teichoic acid export membrane protein
MASSIASPPSDAHRGKRFVLNVFWNWLGVGAGLVTGLLLSPYMIRKIGPEGYGIWALSFALAEYYWFLDLGFRSATVKYVAHYWARAEFDKVSEVVNTGITYAGLTAAIIFTAVAIGGRYLDRFFQISPGYKSSFFALVLLVSLSWCIGVVFSLYGACLEALQRFDYYNRILVTVAVTRTTGQLILLYLGYGLVPIGIVAVSCQILGYLLHFYYFQKVYPEYRISFRGASLPMLKQMGGYGIHNFLGNVSTQVLNQGPPILIGHFQPAQFVGFFQIPIRLLMYTSEAVGRIGIITNSNTAELVARGETVTISKMAIYTNRYCVVLFMPLTIFFLAYGTRFLELWVPKAAEYSAPVLPIMLLAYVIGFVGQFSSGMLLMGLARYQAYSRGLLAEAACSFLALIFVIPRYGIVGAAWVMAIAMILNRGLFLPWLVSRVMRFRYLWFMNSIYTCPVLAGLPLYLLCVWMGRTILPGTRWIELIVAGALVSILYYAIAFFLCLPREHQRLVKDWIGRKVAAARTPVG